ncbi:Muconate cycloisomerase [Arthrobacter sp. 9AX]|nr:Muconate cycloisomerase [Arthrobacter sp. 9AX]
MDRERIHAVLRRTIHNQVAKGAVDIAVWDAIGKTLGTPVHKLLGGYTDRMRVSHMLGFRPAHELLAEARRYRGHYGITTFKLKVGRRPLSLDVEACRVLREGLGDDVEIYLDANRGWTANEALEVLRCTEDLGLSLLEEPCDAKEALGRRRLVEKSPIPVVGDESVPTAGDVSRELLSGGCNAVCMKTARSGFTEATEILGLCTGLGVDETIGNQIDTQIGSLATVTFGASHEATSRRAGELSNFLDMADDLLADPIRIIDGTIAPRPTRSWSRDRRGQAGSLPPDLAVPEVHPAPNRKRKTCCSLPAWTSISRRTSSRTRLPACRASSRNTPTPCSRTVDWPPSGG